MAELMTIQGTQLQVKEYKDKRVVTFKDIDMVHQRPEGTAKRNFNTNRKHFVSGVDFYSINRKEVGTDFVQTYGFDNSAPSGFLITESGYLMLVKSFTDDLAWKVQRDLVDSYFRVKEIPAEEQDIRVSVMHPEMFLEAARIMASVPNSQRYVINCLRHVVSDIDSEQTVAVRVDDKVIDVPVEDNTVIQIAETGGRSYSKPFNHNQFNNYLVEKGIKHYWLQMELGCSSGLIGKWACGQSKPTECYRVKLCDVLGLPEGYFDNTKRVRRIQHI